MKKLEELQASIVNLKEEILEEISKKMKKFESSMSQEIEYLRNENNHLRIKLEEQDQYGRKSDIIVNGLKDGGPNETEEEVMKEVIEMAKKLKVKLDPSEIFASHRLPTKRKTNTHPVLVRLNNLRKKGELIRKSKDMKLDGIYINHYLNTYTRQLLERARELRDEGYVQFAWFGNGFVKVRKQSNTGKKLSRFGGDQSPRRTRRNARESRGRRERRLSLIHISEPTRPY